jgi:Uma2 family endonuclease
MRVKVSSERVRIPDVCLVSRNQPVEQIITRPPLAVREILSPEDRVLRYHERLADYRPMGVRCVWVIDPSNKTGYNCSTTAWLPVEEFRLPESPIHLRLADVWRELESSR